MMTLLDVWLIVIALPAWLMPAPPVTTVPPVGRALAASPCAAAMPGHSTTWPPKMAIRNLSRLEKRLRGRMMYVSLRPPVRTVKLFVSAWSCLVMVRDFWSSLEMPDGAAPSACVLLWSVFIANLASELCL